MPNDVEVFLGGKPEATPDEVKAHYIELCKTAHPDAGGTAEGFADLSARYKLAMAFALQPRMCPTCKGANKVVASKMGFATTWKDCPQCGGTGKIILKLTN